MSPDLDARLKRLQRQNLLLGTVALAAVAVLGLVQLRAARHLRVVSEDGHSELRLEPEALTFLHDGKNVLVLKATEAQTALVGTNRDRTEDFILSTNALAFRRDEHPTTGLFSDGDQRGFSIADDRGQLRVVLILGANGEPLLRLAGKDPAVITDLVIGKEDEQRLAFTRGQGKPVVTVTNGAEWGGCSALNAEGGRASVRLEAGGAAKVLLDDAGGRSRVLSTAP